MQGDDFSWTYVGGTDEAVAEILAHPELEALPVAIDHPLVEDLINPEPD